MTLIFGDCFDVLRAMPDASIDAVVTDPPYGLGKAPDALAMLRDWLDTGHHDVKGRGFMGREWDAFVPQPVLWREVVRVLKPGGYLLAFAGTRTQDLMGLALRLAGFEIRDCLSWLYGTGFPKSLDVAKAIDQNARGGMVRAKLIYFSETRGVDGAWLESKGIASAASFRDWTVGGHVPSDRNWQIVKEALGVTSEEESIYEREVVSRSSGQIGVGWASAGLAGYKSEFNVTAPATAAALQWQGWGTALKPAWEPILMARKPLIGTVAENVLQHGTGAINVNACRIGTAGGTAKGQFPNGPSVTAYGNGLNGACDIVDIGKGRWPANVVLDEVAAALLDEQSGEARSKPRREGLKGGSGFGTFDDSKSASTHGVWPADPGGGASRFFYTAKASSAERELEDGSRSTHPTVKPVDLMRWLVRLVTPPGGVVLDPFMGSGSTGVACVREGFGFIGIEREAEYHAIAVKRLEEATRQGRLDL